MKSVPFYRPSQSFARSGDFPQAGATRKLVGRLGICNPKNNPFHRTSSIAAHPYRVLNSVRHVIFYSRDDRPGIPIENRLSDHLLILRISPTGA